MAQNIRYYNETAPFWDFVSQLEPNASQHPFFNSYAAVPTEEQGERAPRDDATLPPDYEDEKPHPDPQHPDGPPPPGHSGELPHHPGPHGHHRGPHGFHAPPHDRHEGPSGCGRRGGHRRGGFGGFGGWGRGGAGGCGGRGGFGGFGGFGGGRHGHGFPFGHGRHEGGWADFLNPTSPQMEAFKTFMSQFGGGAAGAGADRSASEDKSFTPSCDVFDTPTAFVLHFALPGAKKEDIGVNWDADKSELNVAGVVYRAGDEEFLKTLAMDEREVGVFERKVRLGSRVNPAQVDVDGITAKMDDGVLVVTVPKVEEFVEIKKVDVE